MWCAGFSLRWLLLLWSMGSRHTGFSSCDHSGSVVVPHGLSCSVACGIFPDQGSNPCPLHWQADSQPLHHQGSHYHCRDFDHCSFVVWSEVREPDIPPALFFFLKVALTIWGLLCFHTNRKIFCSNSVKNAIGNLIGITLNL